MKIYYVPVPGSTTTSLLGDFNKEVCLRERKLIVELYMVSMTRVGITLRSGNTAINANYVPSKSQGFKFDLKTDFNFFTGNYQIKHYFKLSRKQSLPQLQEHIKNIAVDYFNLALCADFDIHIYDNKVVEEIKRKFVY